MNDELQRKLAARLKLSGGGDDDDDDKGSNAPPAEAKRASAPGRLSMPAGIGGRFNPASMGGMPSPFAMAGGAAGVGGGVPSPFAMAGGARGGGIGGRPGGNHSAPDAMSSGEGGGGGGGGLIQPLPSKPAGPAGRRKPSTRPLIGLSSP